MTKFLWTSEACAGGYRSKLEALETYDLADLLICTVDCLDQFCKDGAGHPEIAEELLAIQGLRQTLAKLCGITSTEQQPERRNVH